MKKISKLLIGTNNKGKYKEIKDLLPKYIKTHSTTEFKLKSPRETGLTFIENSIIKSKHFSKKTNLICLADDSGLEIDILDKNPGIYSARWGGKNGDFKKATNRVYKELLKKDSSDIDSWKGMADALSQAGYIDRANQCMQRVDELTKIKENNNVQLDEEEELENLIAAAKEVKKKLLLMMKKSNQILMLMSL